MPARCCLLISKVLQDDLQNSSCFGRIFGVGEGPRLIQATEHRVGLARTLLGSGPFRLLRAYWPVPPQVPRQAVGPSDLLTEPIRGIAVFAVRTQVSIGQESGPGRVSWGLAGVWCSQRRQEITQQITSPRRLICDFLISWLDTLLGRHMYIFLFFKSVFKKSRTHRSKV